MKQALSRNLSLDPASYPTPGGLDCGFGVEVQTLGEAAPGSAH